MPRNKLRDKMRYAILILLLLCSFAFAIDISTCAILSSSGSTYILRAPVTSAQTCMNVTGSGITLRCERNTYLIKGANLSGRAGVNVTSKGFTLQDCQLDNWDYDIYANGTTFSGVNTINIVTSQANSTGHAALWVDNWDKLFTDRSTFNAKSQSTQGARIISTKNIEFLRSLFNCTVGSCYGAQIDTSLFPYIHDSYFQSVDSQALYLNNVNDSLISPSNVFNATGKGIALYITGYRNQIDHNIMTSFAGSAIAVTTTARDNHVESNTIISLATGINTAGTSTNNLVNANTFICPVNTATAISVGGTGNNFTSNIIQTGCSLPIGLSSSTSDNNISFNNVTSNNSLPLISMPIGAINSNRNHFENNNLTQGNNTASRNQLSVISIRSTSASNTSFFNNSINYFNGTGLLNVIGTSQNRMLNFTYNRFNTPATFNGAWVNNSDSSANFSTNTEIPPIDITATKVCNASAGTSGVCFNTNIQDNVNWSLDETTSVGSPYEGNISITNTSLNDTVNIIYLSFYANYRTVGFAHHVLVNIWNGTGWIFTGQELAHNLPQWYNLSLYGTSYIKSNTVNVQFQHVENGNAAHAGIDIDFMGLQVANYHQGNYYPNMTAYACYDVSGDGFCDVGGDWPFNQTTLGASLWCANGTDFGPAIARPITPTNLNWTGAAMINASSNTSRYVLFSWNFSQVYPLSGVSCILGVNGTNYSATVGMGTCSYLWDGEFNGYGQFNITGYVINSGFGLSSTNWTQNKKDNSWWNYTLYEPLRPTNCSWIEPAVNNSNTTNMTQRFRWSCNMNGTNISACLLQVQNASGYFNVSGDIGQICHNTTLASGGAVPIWYGVWTPNQLNIYDNNTATFSYKNTAGSAGVEFNITDDQTLLVGCGAGTVTMNIPDVCTAWHGFPAGTPTTWLINSVDDGLGDYWVQVTSFCLGADFDIFTNGFDYGCGFTDIADKYVYEIPVIESSALTYSYPCIYSCLQEFANTSASCGGLDTGASWNSTPSGTNAWNLNGNPPDALFDGNFATGAYANCGAGYSSLVNYTSNYSKFQTVNNATIWRVSIDSAGTSEDLPIPDACWNANISALFFTIMGNTTNGCFSGYMNYTCWNGTGWQLLDTKPTGWFMEDDIIWGLDNITFCEADYTQTYCPSCINTCNRILPINITGITINNNSLVAVTQTWSFSFIRRFEVDDELDAFGTIAILCLSVMVYYGMGKASDKYLGDKHAKTED